MSRVQPLNLNFSAPQFERAELANGIVLLLLEKKDVPLVNFKINVNAGAAMDPPGLSGLANLTAALLHCGTARRTASQIRSEADAMSSNLDIMAGYDNTIVAAEVLKQDVEPFVDLVADVLLNPVFPQSEFEREHKQTLSELDQVRENAATLTDLLLLRGIYPDDPYGTATIGSVLTLGKITCAHVREYYQKTFRRAGLTIAIAGDLDSAAIRKIIEDKLGPGPFKGEDAKHDQISVGPPKHIFVAKEELNQAHVRLVGPGVIRNHPDFIPLLVTTTILGGSYLSKLVQEIRVKKGLSYAAMCSPLVRRRAGLVKIGSYTNSSNLKVLIEVILAQARDMIEGRIEEDDLITAQNYLKGQYALNFESIGALSSILLAMENEGLSADDIAQYYTYVSSVSTADAVAMSDKYINPDEMLWMVCGNQAALKSYGKFGKAEPWVIKDYL